MQIHHKIFDDLKLNLLRKNIEQFITLTDHEFEIVISHFTFKTIKKHQFLLLEGDICYHDYFVIQGALRKYYIQNNKEHAIQFAFENWWISDWSSMLDEKPSAYYIEALEDCEVLQIEKESLEALVREFPGFEKFYRINFQRAYVAMERRVSNIQKSADQSFKEFRSTYGDFEQRLSLSTSLLTLVLQPNR